MFSGTVGLALKVALLAILNAIAVWAAVVLVDDGKWVALAVLAAATVAIDAIYLSRRAVPAKFLVPGTVFLLAFSVIPILYTVNVAFSNWSTGHVLVKEEAIDGIQRNSLSIPPDGRSYVMAPARDDGELVLLLVDEATGKPFLGTRDGLEPLPEGSVRVDEVGTIVSAESYRLVRGPELVALDRELSKFLVPTEGSAAIRPEGLGAAVELEPTMRYDPKTDTFTRIESGLVFRDNGRGSFVAPTGEELEPGWRTRVGFDNFTRIVDDPLVQKPFVRVFIWTFAFAFLTVVLSFALGLFLAIALDVPGMRFQRTYRSLLVVPYAIPGFLSTLVWAGLLNDDFGVVNRILHTDIPWLFDGNWAKVSIILVSVWLTAPYFFLVSLGALQSIPNELVEAARVDGGGPWQVFRKITLPLLFVAVAPLMIASFAFNFNNFGNIYLLTRGGPAAGDESIAGATDILITYTYKLAIESGKGQDFALASAISILIFFIVASISAVGFWRTKSLENLA
ncbi:MAG: ABC transporter permease subunit [Actinomycetota bacterium]|nr:ABC transporter permease subunit [Actinomycetota bacterium]